MPFSITNHWDSAQTQLALMLDYDGTLTPIVNDPNKAGMTEAHLDLLRQLASHPHIHLAIVSGRSVEQLRQFLHPLFDTRVLLCGMHGGEVYQPDSDRFLKSVDSELYHGYVTNFHTQLSKAFTPQQWESGLMLELKDTSIALHYRMAEEPLQQKAIATFEALYHQIPQLPELFRVQQGKHVLEIVPKAFNKGDGVRFLAQHWAGYEPLTLCYAGDDLTDEAAFAVVNARNGISVCIDKNLSDTQANHTLPSVNALYDQLWALAQHDKACLP